MNEMMQIYLKLEDKTRFEARSIIQRMDSFLLEYGVKHSGMSNVYIPMVSRERDDVFYTARKALAECDWLKGILAQANIVNKVDVCQIEDINVRRMSEPSEAKYKYYEQYYADTHELAHGILVDENRCLREGYIAYLLSLKYGVKAEIMEVLSAQPIKKTVAGRHMSRANGKFQFRRTRKYTWNYELRDPVVRGDILAVGTAESPQFMCVESIGYLTGKKFCEEHKAVRAHTHCRMPSVG